MPDGCKDDWRKDHADKGRQVSVKTGFKWLRGGWGQAATEPLAFSEPKDRGASGTSHTFSHPLVGPHTSVPQGFASESHLGFTIPLGRRRVTGIILPFSG